MLSTMRLSKTVLTILVLGLALLSAAKPIMTPSHDSLPQSHDEEEDDEHAAFIPGMKLTNQSSSLWNPSINPATNHTSPTPTNLTLSDKGVIKNCKSLCIPQGLRPTFDQGRTHTSNPRTIAACLNDLRDNLNPDTPRKSPGGEEEEEEEEEQQNKEPKHGRDHHWKREGWQCGNRIFQLGKQHGTISAAQTVRLCSAFADKAVKEGRDWFNCQVNSPHGVSTHTWFGWSPLGCRMGEEHEPRCKAGFVAKKYPLCFEEPCRE